MQTLNMQEIEQIAGGEFSWSGLGQSVVTGAAGGGIGGLTGGPAGAATGAALGAVGGAVVYGIQEAWNYFTG